MKTVSYTKTFVDGWMKGMTYSEEIANASDTFIKWANEKERTQSVVKPAAGCSKYTISSVIVTQ